MLYYVTPPPPSASGLASEGRAGILGYHITREICRISGSFIVGLPPKGAWGCLMSPPRSVSAVIRFRATISALVLLPSPATLSVFFFLLFLSSACWPIPPNFFPRKFFSIFL